MAQAPSNPPGDASEGFLSRWSRRKDEERRFGDAMPSAVEATPLAPAPTEPAEEGAGRPPAEPALPPIESLTAESDFTAFIRPDVPAPIQREALRKLWASVPSLAPIEIAETHMADFNAVPTFPDGLKDTLFDAARGLVERVLTPEEPGGTDCRDAAAPVPVSNTSESDTDPQT